MTFRLRSRRAILAAVTATVALLITLAPPAWAHGSGETTNGASTIHGDAQPSGPLCLPFTDTLIIELWNEGSFNNRPGPYETLATFTSDQDFFFSPAGTFSDPLCTMPTAVTGKLRVNNDVTCPSVNANYQRTTSVYEIETTQRTACTITGTSNTHNAEHLKFTGVQQACSDEAPDPCDPNGTPNDDSDNVEFVGTYEQGV